MIRHAELGDLEEIIQVYDVARKYMQDSGHAQQWGLSYPSKELLKSDIQQKCLYVLEGENRVYGVFALFFGDDPTYSYIENGSWLNDDPYGTIHRIASDGSTKGVFEECLTFCKTQISNLRIDTHENNKTMQHIVEKSGFEKCGIIYVDDGSPRIAYHSLN